MLSQLLVNINIDYIYSQPAGRTRDVPQHCSLTVVMCRRCHSCCSTKKTVFATTELTEWSVITAAERKTRKTEYQIKLHAMILTEFHLKWRKKSNKQTQTLKLVLDIVGQSRLQSRIWGSSRRAGPWCSRKAPELHLPYSTRLFTDIKKSSSTSSFIDDNSDVTRLHLAFVICRRDAAKC